MAWAKEQKFEAGWWGACTNTLGEQFRHPTYARLMGLDFINDGGQYLIDIPGKSVLDMGGGPVSMLLDTRGATRLTVVDPCPYPKWTRQRYKAAGIEVVRTPGEEFSTKKIYDEAWCYNVLQHVQDPQQMIAVMRRSARVIRMVEWVDLAPHKGHPHTLTSEKLAKWGHFDTGWWRQTAVEWEHKIGEHRPYQAFHGWANGRS